MKVLHHTYNWNKGDYSNHRVIESNELYTRYFPFGHLAHVWDYTHTYGVEFNVYNVDMKSVCVKREVLEKYKWVDKDDVDLYKGTSNGTYYEFAVSNLYTYNRSVLIDAPLNYKAS